MTLQAPLQLSREEIASIFWVNQTLIRPLVPVLNHSGCHQADIQDSGESGNLVPEGKIKAVGHT